MRTLIKLGIKFSSNDFNRYISTYYAQTLELTTQEVHFDLEELEWISLEGITFLFAWINKIKNDNTTCNVKIKLPNPGPIVINGELNEDKNKQKRRSRRLKSLLETWQLNNSCGISTNDYINPPSSLNTRIAEWRKNYFYSDNNWNRIVPFRKFDTSKYENIDNVRTHLSDEVNDVFSFEEDVRYKLNKFFINTPFENKTISHLITTELFLNTLHHTKRGNNNKNECYFSIAATNKYNEDDIKEWLYGEKIQKYIELNRCDYYQAKQTIGDIDDTIEPWQVKNRLNKKIKETLPQNIENERNMFVWDFFKGSDGQYKNISYIEFAFIDFGSGIPTTLKDNYEQDINNGFNKSRLCKNHFDCNSIDSRILEYAFLLETSETPFDKNLEIQEYVPRGLYFLLDMVRLYKGLLVVRSKEGEVAFDFSKTQDIKESVRLSEPNYSFPGTMINIILPEQSSNAVILAPVQLSRGITLKKINIEYISVLDIYNSFQREYKSDEPYKSIDLYNHFFLKLNKILDETQSKNQRSIIYFDFAGANLPFMDEKIFYFLANSPKINQQTNLILLNISQIELLDVVRQKLLNFKPFIFRPIPCVIEERDSIKIKWIGVQNIDDEKNLTNLLMYPIEYTLAASDFNAPVDSLKGNVIEVKWIDKTAANVQKSQFLPDLSAITYINSKLLNDRLRNRILKPDPKKEEEEILLKSDNTVYLSSGGYYLYQYVHFFDTLFSKDAKNRAYSENIAINLFNLWRVKKDIIPDKIDWILTVTLSSQMLGRDIRKVYKRLMMHDENEKSPRLLKLTNYNEFSNELVFEQIKKDDTILVVNDVISTGSLNKKIYDSIKKKNAKIIGFFSIVDCRVPPDNYEEDDKKELEEAQKYKEYEIKSVFDSEIDDITVSLVDKLYIRKYDRNVKNAEKIIRINPMTNAPTTMGLQHSEEIKIIYPNISDVFKKIKKEHFLIGYFKNNNAYHTYFPNTENIFLQYSGKEFIRDLIEKVIVFEKKRKYFEKDKDEKKENDKDLKVDYVFYPVFSGIEAFDDYHFQNYFNNKDLLSYPIPRIDTPKGWRFTFPPKVLNKTIKNKVVFIIDDGSCSGETILQMIDSICFYEVEKIIVLFVFGRLEDFQREFYSRIKKMKVKKLKDKNIENQEDLKEPIVDVHIYFGTQLNIHHFPYEKSTPFVDERKQLKTYQNDGEEKPPSTLSYINKRVGELKIVDVIDINNATKLKYYHFPKIKESESVVDIEKIFEIRNKLGKLDSYRIFENYYYEVDYKNDDDLELIIGIVNHEPRILDTIKNLVPELYQRLKEFIYKIVFQEYLNLSKRHYRWDNESLLMFLFIIDYSILYNAGSLQSLFCILEKKMDNFEYISFVLWKETKGYGICGESVRATVFSIWYNMYKENNNNTAKYYRLLNSIIATYRYKEDIPKTYIAFENLHIYYLKETAKPKHKTVEEYINNAIPVLQNTSNDKIDFRKVTIAIDGIRDHLKKNIDKILSDDFIKEHISSLYSSFEKINEKIKEINSTYEELIEIYKTNQEKIPISETNNNLRNKLGDCFVLFNKEYSDINTDFGKLCFEIYTDPLELWKEAVNKFTKTNDCSKINFNIEQINEEMEQLKFFIHREALNEVFRNIINNIYSCSQKSDKKIVINYRTDNKNGIQIFALEQNITFQIEDFNLDRSGLSIIDGIIEKYDGKVYRPSPNQGNNMYYHFIFNEHKNN